MGAKRDIGEALKLYIDDCIAAGDEIPRSAAKIVTFDTLSVAVGNATMQMAEDGTH